MLAGDFKQEIMKLHNAVNISIFGQGLRWQKVEFFHDKIIIVAHNKRVPALNSLDETDRFTTRMMDLALLMQFKSMFKQELENFLSFEPLAVLKDYDPKSEMSMCAVLLDRSVEELLPSI